MTGDLLAIQHYINYCSYIINTARVVTLVTIVDIKQSLIDSKQNIQKSHAWAQKVHVVVELEGVVGWKKRTPFLKLDVHSAHCVTSSLLDWLSTSP